MISYRIDDEALIASDRVFRPEHPRTLSAEWPDPLGLNQPASELRGMHEQLIDFVRSNAPARKKLLRAMDAQSYRIAEYFGLGTSESIEDMTQDLQWFAQNADGIASPNASFIAIFDDVSIRDEDDFEHQLWSQLIGMLNFDNKAHGWCPGTHFSPNHADVRFGIAGHEFSVIGLHPHASEPARRFAYPTLVFTPAWQRQPKTA